MDISGGIKYISVDVDSIAINNLYIYRCNENNCKLNRFSVITSIFKFKKKYLDHLLLHTLDNKKTFSATFTTFAWEFLGRRKFSCIEQSVNVRFFTY